MPALAVVMTGPTPAPYFGDLGVGIPAAQKLIEVLPNVLSSGGVERSNNISNPLFVGRKLVPAAGEEQPDQLTNGIRNLHRAFLSLRRPFTSALSRIRSPDSGLRQPRRTARQAGSSRVSHRLELAFRNPTRRSCRSRRFAMFLQHRSIARVRRAAGSDYIFPQAATARDRA